jgi:hypothetical protein
MHSSLTLAAVLVGALGVRSASVTPSLPATTYRTNSYSVDARWLSGVSPNRIYFDVVAWSGTETVGAGEPIRVAGANAGWSVEQPDGTFLPQQGCSPSGAHAAAAGFTFPKGAFFVEPGLRSARLSLTFDCFAAIAPYNPTGISLKVVMDWNPAGPTSIETGGRTGNSTFVERMETIAIGSATDGAHEYAPRPSDFARVVHQISDVVTR